jgi:hypothetical protein
MLTRTYPEPPQAISDLAADLTDLALEHLSKTGVRGDSVALELALWRTLAAEIERGLPLGGPIEPIIRRAALRVAGGFGQRRPVVRC